MIGFRLTHWLKTRLWAIPTLFVLGGIATSQITTRIDPASEIVPPVVVGDTTAAMQILYLTAFSMLTLTGLVLSLLVLSVQLAMSAFSPRIVRQILQDRPSQCAIGLFAGTFTHALLTIPAVRTNPDGGGSVPGLAVLTSILLVLSCIITLVWYLNHIGQSLRVAALVGWVAEDTLGTLHRTVPAADPVTVDQNTITAAQGGVVFEVSHQRLLAIARRADCRLEVLPAVGDFVPTGGPLIRIHDADGPVDRTRAARCVVLGPERTLNQDVAYGIRMLVDIAVGAVSGGPFDDPTTAVQAIDRLHDILRQIAHRPLPSGVYTDAAGNVRLTVPTVQWDGYVLLAFEELRRAGADSPQVTRRLLAALEDLLSMAPPDRRSPLEHQRDLMLEAGSEMARGAESAVSLTPDPSGIGTAPDLVTPADRRDDDEVNSGSDDAPARGRRDPRTARR